MKSLPSGTVAFLMTDIEGSTRMIGRLGDMFPLLLDDHLALLDGAINDNRGTLVSAEGDSVFAVFPSVREAISAALAAQRALAAHPWPEGVKLAEELTDKQRLAMMAVNVHGMPLEAVAQQMGTSRNTLYKLLHDARLRLKQRLLREGLTPQDVLAAFADG